MCKTKLIALDMDGTLLNDEGIVTDYTKKVLKKAAEQNVHVLLSTGRPLEMCVSYAEDLQLSSYIITSNGAEIYTANQELVEQQALDVETLEKMWEIGHKKNIHMWMIASDAVFVEGKRPSDFSDHTWLKLGYGHLNDSDKTYVMEALEKLGPLEITNSSLVNLEVNAKGVNKANAIHSVCKRLGITMDQVFAIGDSLNDYQMIKEAGIGVAVQNAQETILDLADYVTENNNDDGVAKAIEKFVLK